MCTSLGFGYCWGIITQNSTSGGAFPISGYLLFNLFEQTLKKVGLILFKPLALGAFIVILGLSSSYITEDWNTLMNISGVTTIVTLVLSAILSDFPIVGKIKTHEATTSNNGPPKKESSPKNKLAWNLIFVGLPNLVALFVVSFIFEDFLFDPDIIYPMWFQTLFYIGAILMIFHSINIVKYWMEGRSFFQWLREDHGTYIKWMIIFTIIYAVGLILIKLMFPR